MRYRRTILTWAVLTAGLAWATAIVPSQAAESPDTRRIVSVGGAVTEILYALGEGERIVGIDTTSLYPPQAVKEKPSVGYMRQLSAEGVLGLQPGLILAIEGTGPKDTLAILQAAKVPLRVVPDVATAAGILDKIRFVARAVNATLRGECLARQVTADLAALAALEDGIRPNGRKRVLFVLSFVNGRAMVAGRGTAAGGIIGMAGGVNAAEGFDGYKVVSDEAIVAAAPDVVLTMEREGASLTADDIFAQPAFAMTPAAAKRGFVSMEGLYLLGFGPRTARAARDLAAALYPDLKAGKLPSEDATAPETCAP